MGKPDTPLAQIIQHLQDFYGSPELPPVTEPFELILWENIAYLADDQTRSKAYALLKKSVGLTPSQILAAPDTTLLEVARVGGMLPEQRVAKLRNCAQLALAEFEDDGVAVLKKSLAQSKKILKKFPGIGEPGAEKILLFSRLYPALALESNGLRVLLRLGFGEEKKDYGTTYRLIKEALRDEIRLDFDWLIEAHQLLRRHGQELCKRSMPLCNVCPLHLKCNYYRNISVSEN